MNKQIRQLGFVILLLFVVLFVQLNNIQVLQASKLDNDPRNNRKAVRTFSSPRGVIKTADGLVIAQSIPSNDKYQYQRQYPTGDLFGQITGFYSFTYGNDGLERTYNNDLTGKTTGLRHISDLLTDRVHTNDVTITIDSHLQQVAKDSLGNNKGAVVALNPKTGEVLAMYSNPSFDPSVLATHDFPAATAARNSLLADQNNPMLARAFRESYPPGSTFKLVTASAAYDQQPDLTMKTYPTNSSIALPQSNKRLSNFGGEVCGGELPHLLTISCNTGFAQMGLDLGAKQLSGEANGFGFNQVPPLDEPSTARSRFPDAASFKGRLPFLAYAAIGQGDVSATPLQMALVAAAIGHGGVVMKPHLLKEVRDDHGDVVKSAKPVEWLRPISQGTAKLMTDNMINVVNAGTGTAARIPGIQVAGKTGTAQTQGDYIDAWFACFAPANDAQIAVAVVVEHQLGVSEATGGRVAAPIAQKVIKAALKVG